MRSLRPRLLTTHAAPAVLTALWSPVTWRATRSALAGLVVAVVGMVVVGVPIVAWGAALFTLSTDENNVAHVALYAASLAGHPGRAALAGARADRAAAVPAARHAWRGVPGGAAHGQPPAVAAGPVAVRGHLAAARLPRHRRVSPA